MKQYMFLKIGVVVLGVLLLANSIAAVKARAAARSQNGAAIQYRLVRVDSSTNEDLLFKQAGEQGLEFVGTIEVAGNTGYIIFRR